jgi:hypothetical protein
MALPEHPGWPSFNQDALPPRTLLQHGGGVLEHGIRDPSA